MRITDVGLILARADSRTAPRYAPSRETEGAFAADLSDILVNSPQSSLHSQLPRGPGCESGAASRSLACCGPTRFSAGTVEILLVARGHPVPKDRLAEHLWGEVLPRDPSAAVERHVSVLRSRLASLQGGSQIVVTEHMAYRLAAERIDLDLDRFDQLVGRAAGSSLHLRRPHLERALDLARGEVLEDEPYAEWTEPLRDEYRQRVTNVRLDTAETALERADFAEAKRHAERVLAADPISERAWRTLMLAHYALGEQAEAVGAFGRCRAQLREQLGVEPDRETEGLYLAILRQRDSRFLAGLPRHGPGADDGQWYRNLFEEAPLAYFCVDIDGRVRMANHRAGELTGYGEDGLLGRAVLDLYANTSAGKPLAGVLFSRFRAGAQIRGERLEGKTGGSHRSVEARAAQVNGRLDAVGLGSYRLDGRPCATISPGVSTVVAPPAACAST